ncbi:MAG: four helix bundle protein [Phycisphaerales bacterium]|nr:four helix bundle protein [Phycisphaerales bacterium]
MARARSSVQRFEDLKVWQAGRELVKGVYRAAKTQELRKDRGLVDQITRAAVSVTSNIAEGHERGSRAQYIESCFIAKGSAGEVRSQLINAHDVGLLDEQAYNWLHDKCTEVSRMLAGYIKHLVETSNTMPGMKFTRAADRSRMSWDEFLAEHGIKQLPNGQCVSVGTERKSSQNGE